jgi:hypothetical protein
MHDRVLDETTKIIKQLLDEGISDSNNLDYLDKLVDIQKDTYKIKSMKEGNEMYGNYGNYGENYGRRAGYDSYGRDSYGRDNYGENSYGRRGYDTKYRGHDHLERMYDNYGRYMYGRERYGNSEDTKKSLKYMLESMEDFAKMLRDEAQSQEEVQMIRETAQRIAQM